MDAINTWTFEHDGREYTAAVYLDNDSGKPWDNCDLLGRVYYRLDFRNRFGYCTKRGGERILATDRHGAWLFDWQGAAARARREVGKDHIRSVQSDFDYARGWLNDDWHYVGLQVTDDGGLASSLWGIDTDDQNYLNETAADLAEELAHERARRTYPIHCCGI